jgi:hypothetical protein
MDEVEEKVRAALREKARRLDEMPEDTEPPHNRLGLGQVLAVLVASVFIIAAIAAIVWVRGDKDLAQGSSVTPSPDRSVSPTPTPEVCSPAPFTVHRLPWLQPGASVPAPELMEDGRDSIQVWFEDPVDRWSGRYVAVETSYAAPFAEDLSEFPKASVRGQTGHIIWVGDPGVGALALAWAEGTGPCSWYSLSLSSAGMGEQEARATLGRLATSIQ